MIKHRTLGYLAILTFAWLAPMAYAQVEPYIGFGYGQYKFEFESSDIDTDFDDDQNVWRLFGGVQLNKALGLELSIYNFDDARDRGLRSELEGASLAAIFAAPLHERFALFAKVGWFWWEADIKGTAVVIPGEPPLREDFDGDDVFFGAGLKVGLTDSVDLRIEYDRFELDRDINPDLDMASISLQARF